MRGKRIGHAEKKFSLVKELTNRDASFLHQKREKVVSGKLRFPAAARACPAPERSLMLVSRQILHLPSNFCFHVIHHHFLRPRRR
jgi:hypothetical protein